MTELNTNPIQFGDSIKAFEMGEDRQRRREEAAYRKQIMDTNLKRMGMRQEAGIDQLELDNVKAELMQTRNQLAKQATYQTFDNFLADGDVNHVNRLIKENPVVASTMPDVLRIDPIALDNQEDQRLFQQQSGFSLAEFSSIADMEKAKKRFVKVTTKAGEQKVVDMQQILAGSGYLNYKDAQRRAQLIEDMKLEKDMADIEYKGAMARKADRWEPSMGGTGMQGPTARVRDAEAVGEARTRIEQGKGTPADYALLERHDEETIGNTPGKQRRIDQEEQNLFSSFGGEQGFYSQKFEPNTQEFNQAMRSVRKIEALSGVELSNKQVETIGNIRKTIAAGQRAAGLQPGDVGLVDNVLKKLGAYVSDDAMGAEARSAWAGIRNQLLHAFAGSAMNEGELERWGEQFGNLYQQGGHVMTTLANALDQLGGELDSLRVALPEASFHVRLGSDVERLNTVITNISTAAATLSNKANPQGKMQPMQPNYPVNPPGYQTGQREVQQPVKSEADKLREMLLQRQQRQGAN